MKPVDRHPRKIRIALSIFSALLITLLCLWTTVIYGRPLLERRQDWARRTIEKISESVEKYRAQKGRLPSTLDILQKDKELSVRTRDIWKNPIRYEVKGNKYLITSYGQDGKKGGTGLNADLSNLNPKPPEAWISAGEIFLNEELKGMPAFNLLAGLVTFILVYLALPSTQPKSRAEIRALLGKVFVMLLVTGFFAFCMTFLDVVVRSGH